MDEFLLILHRLPEVCVKGSFGHIAVHMDKGILVALALDTALALGEVSGSPRTIQIMKCHQTVLHIGACAHLGSAAHKYTHLTGTNFGEQLLFPLNRMGINSWLTVWFSFGLMPINCRCSGRRLLYWLTV